MPTKIEPSKVEESCASLARNMFETSNVSFKQLARSIGVCENSARRKMAKGTWKMHEFLILARLCGYKVGLTRDVMSMKG